MPSNMSAFGEFGPLSERRKAELASRRKKKLIIASTSVFLLVAVVAAGAAVVSYSHGQGLEGSKSSHPGSSSSDSSPSSATTTSVSSPSGDGPHATAKAVKMMCSFTTYKNECETTMTKSLNNSSSSLPKPKELISAAVSVIGEKVAGAFSHSTLIKSDDPMVKGAIEDCKELFQNAKEELLATLDTIKANNLDDLMKRSHDLTNWLSAVMSYQETCGDGFPEGEFKTKMKDAMKSAKHVTSNGLAIIGQASSFLSMSKIPIPGPSRRLMSAEQNSIPAFREDGFPHWVSEADRRHLKELKTAKLKPNVVVAKDGSGNFKSINEALAALPKSYSGRYIIYVKEGIYEEEVLIGNKMENITMYGDGSRKSIVTGSKNFADGVRTFKTATFAAQGSGFVAIGMGFRNTAGAIKHQAVALRVQSDRSIFLNCRMEGYQDTLYAQTHFQFYRGCVIAGTVDFIFGDATAVFQNCVMLLRRPLDNQQNIVTAQGRADKFETTGFVLQACRFEAEPALTTAGKPPIRSYLGRPWKQYSRTIIMESEIGGFINPDGYLPWEGNFALDTLSYREYGNTGPGANTSKRVKWPGFKVITNRADAQKFTISQFFADPSWIKPSGTPVTLSFYH